MLTVLAELRPGSGEQARTRLEFVANQQGSANADTQVDDGKTGEHIQPVRFPEKHDNEGSCDDHTQTEKKHRQQTNNGQLPEPFRFFLQLN